MLISNNFISKSHNTSFSRISPSTVSEIKEEMAQNGAKEEDYKKLFSLIKSDIAGDELEIKRRKPDSYSKAPYFVVDKNSNDFGVFNSLKEAVNFSNKLFKAMTTKNPILKQYGFYELVELLAPGGNYKHGADKNNLLIDTLEQKVFYNN